MTASTAMIADQTAPQRESMNDDRSPLLTLMSCISCDRTMRLESCLPDSQGRDILQYHCGQCDRIERVRLIRRTWPERC